jgi:putative peptidoglycan lipid II flippase
MSFLKSASQISLWTVASRITGFFREVVAASYIGSGVFMDALVIAIKFPSFLRRLTAEGAFSVCFIPLFSGILNKSGTESARRFASQIFFVLLSILGAVTVLFVIFAPQIVPFILPGLKESPERLAYAVFYSRVSFPFIIFISLTALYGGILNAYGCFAAFAASPFLGNVFIIAFVLAVAFVFGLHSPSVIAAIFIGSVTLSACVQFLTVFLANRRQGLSIRPMFPQDLGRLRTFFKKLGPAAFGSGISQVNLFVGLFIASWLPVGGLSYLNYADRLIQLPTSVIGTAMSVALLPLLARHISCGNTQAADKQQEVALMIALLVSGLFVVAFMSLPELLVTFVFKRGAFHQEAAVETSRTLMGYAWGLPAYVMAKILSSRAFARGMTQLPLLAGGASVITDIVLSLALLSTYQYVGIAFATSAAAWVNVLILGVLLKKSGEWCWPRKLIIFALKLGGVVLFLTLLFKHILNVAILGWDHRFLTLIFFGCLITGLFTLCLFSFFPGDVRLMLTYLRCKKNVESTQK